MQFSVSHEKRTHGSSVIHEAPDGHSLRVSHTKYNPDYPRDTTHFVHLSAPGGHHVGMWYPTRQDAHASAYMGQGEYASPPSPELQRLIEAHAADPERAPWYAVLDKMAEEYPDHFGHPVDRHTAARNES